jgi:hypothetical protein
MEDIPGFFFGSVFFFVYLPFGFGASPSSGRLSPSRAALAGPRLVSAISLIASTTSSDHQFRDLSNKDEEERLTGSIFIVLLLQRLHGQLQLVERMNVFGIWIRKSCC